MNNFAISIREELEELSEPKYQKFASALIPNCNNLIGVRIPAIRKIAKRIAKENPLEYLSINDEKYFEETMLKALIIGNLNENINIVLKQLALFIPKVDNWSVCDSLCNELKILSKNKNITWTFLQPYVQSKKAYEIRVAVVIMLFYFIDEKHVDLLFDNFNKIKHEDYYVKMAVAWAVSMCFVKFREKTTQFLSNNTLDDETQNKAIQKIRESLRVDKETKDYVNQFKRKK